MKKSNTFYFNIFILRPCQIIALILLLVSLIEDWNVLMVDIRNTIIIIICVGAFECMIRCTD